MLFTTDSVLQYIFNFCSVAHRKLNRAIWRVFFCLRFVFLFDWCYENFPARLKMFMFGKYAENTRTMQMMQSTACSLIFFFLSFFLSLMLFLFIIWKKYLGLATRDDDDDDDDTRELDASAA